MPTVAGSDGRRINVVTSDYEGDAKLTSTGTTRTRADACSARDIGRRSMPRRKRGPGRPEGPFPPTNSE